MSGYEESNAGDQRHEPDAAEIAQRKFLDDSSTNNYRLALRPQEAIDPVEYDRIVELRTEAARLLLFANSGVEFN